MNYTEFDLLTREDLWDIICDLELDIKSLHEYIQSLEAAAEDESVWQEGFDAGYAECIRQRC